MIVDVNAVDVVPVDIKTIDTEQILKFSLVLLMVSTLKMFGPSTIRHPKLDLIWSRNLLNSPRLKLQK